MSPDGNPGGPFLRTISVTAEIPRSQERAYALRAEWSDEALMAAVGREDVVAFSVVYDRYADLVFSATLRILANSHAAEDVTQDIFVRLWRRPEMFVAERGRFVSWLMSVARHRAVDEVRARGRRGRYEAPPESDALAYAVIDQGNDPAREAQAKDDRTAVRLALAGLPREQRMALELAYFGGLTQQEIAVQLGEPLGTIKTRIRLGMQKLRRALGDRA